jgi:hypothetical protein
VLPSPGRVARIVKVRHLLLLWQLLRPALAWAAQLRWLSQRPRGWPPRRSTLPSSVSPIRLRERVFCLVSGSRD